MNPGAEYVLAVSRLCYPEVISNMSDEGAKTSFKLTFIPAEGIFEKRSEFINNISDNFNAIMQTKSSPAEDQETESTRRGVYLNPVRE